MDIAEMYKFNRMKKSDIDIFAHRNRHDNDNFFIRRSSTSTIFMPASIGVNCYNMNHKNRGKCIIFNHEKFDFGINKRESSSIDVKNLKDSFSKLEFDVEIKNDLCYIDIMNEIEKLRQYDHTDNDCLCIIVLTHIQQQNLLWAKDAAYRPENIWKPFTADMCTTLAGKPKLFFFPTRGDNQIDKDAWMPCRAILAEEADTVTFYTIPAHEDFLMVYSSAQNFYSWKNPEKGTWYIQCLCEILNKCGTKMDLMNILTLTAQKISTFNNPKDQTIHCIKQIPSVVTMLTRLVYFPPKSTNI